MTIRDEHSLRDFVHTVDVLTASALAEHERDKSARLAPATQPVRRRYAALATSAAMVVAVLAGGTYGGFQFTRWQPDPGREIASLQQQSEAVAARPQAAPAPSAAAPPAAAARRMGTEAEASRQRQALMAEERARREAESSRMQVAELAAERAEAARRAAEERIAAEKRVATLEPPGKTEDRVVAVTLSADERATFIKRVQEALKVSQCYDGAVDGRSNDAQKGLDRFVEGARKKGIDRPGPIELAKATQSDFDTWLRDAADVKGNLCVKPKPIPKPPAMVQSREPRVRDPSARAQQRSAPSYSSGVRSGGGGGAPIEGVR